MVEDLEGILESKEWTTEEDLVELKQYDEALGAAIDERATAAMEEAAKNEVIRAEIKRLRTIIIAKIQSIKGIKTLKDGDKRKTVLRNIEGYINRALSGKDKISDSEYLDMLKNRN